MRRYVIVGGGPAGVHAALSARAQDPDGSIVIIDREPDATHRRTELDTYIAGLTPEAELPLFPEPIYHEHRIDLRLRVAVTRVHPADRALELEDGGRIEYDALLLAPGSRPVAGPWPGAGLRGVTTVRSWEEARRVVAALDQTGRPVIVAGGGVLGLILAEGIRERGKAVLVLERERALWAPYLDEQTSLRVQAALEDAGVEVGTGEEVTAAIGRDGRLASVQTSRGRRVDTDLLLVAIGARPALGFLDGSGVRIDRGIVVDHEFRTSLPGVFAAGDAAQAYDPATGFFRVVTNWDSAVEQGRLAGAAMAGAPKPYKGVIVANSETFAGLRVSVMGDPRARGAGVVVLTGRQDAQGLYRRLVLRRNQLVGALLLGNVAGGGMMKQAILEGKPMSPADAKAQFLTGMIIEETKS